MKIKGEAKLILFDHEWYMDLILEVKFKLPEQIFSRTRRALLWKSSGKTFAECLAIIDNVDQLHEMAKEVILEYIKEKYKHTDKDDFKMQIDVLINKINKDFKVEVEYPDPDK
ncbi:hypothetical protein NV379_01945 [Paenibacillus sp. N1-5-1-14]|uniref:hypothetical protein n=1 Tax=Paenibacillus radicibacter TaxID=2972488 RepID=UPI0021591CFF|nr:hypothetical protein [Paenibacillus radicibacter]MCR8641407.1 hypothetical protein [Paenibacillus radicibacter]